jgi:hypothetical protein
MTIVRCAADGFHRGLAGGEFLPVVDAAWRVESDLAGRGDVQHVVDLAVPSAAEAVADLLTRSRAGPSDPSRWPPPWP